MKDLTKNDMVAVVPTKFHDVIMLLMTAKNVFFFLSVSIINSTQNRWRKGLSEAFGINSVE